MFVCAGDSEQFDFATPIGIGMVDAAIRLTRLCLEHSPDTITFVGTAGSYGSKAIFDIIESHTAVNIENGFFDGKTYTPIDNWIEVPERPMVSRETIINSSHYITTDYASAVQYLSNDIDLENMEFYAVLKVAKTFGVPAKGIFIVTNYCNGDAHRDFVANHDEAKRRLSDYIRKHYA